MQERTIEAALYSKQEAAKYLGICLATMTKVEKTIHCVRIGRRVMFEKSDLDAYIEKCKVRSLI